MSNDRQLTALVAQLRKIPSSAELAPEDIRQAVNQVEQEAKKILRTHGGQWPKAHERIGADFVSGELALFEQEVGPNRVRQKPLRDDLRPYVEALALAWHARVWVDADLLPEARRALLAARERIEGARDRAAKAKRQASNAGKAKRGKLLPHNQLIHRALIYDEDMEDRGENWLDNAPRRRTLPNVLTLLENNCEELITGGDVGPRLRLRSVEVDRDSKRLDVVDSDGRERLISFKTLADTIAKLRKNIR